jgi:hypothetical protein
MVVFPVKGFQDKYWLYVLDGISMCGFCVVFNISLLDFNMWYQSMVGLDSLARVAWAFPRWWIKGR